VGENEIENENENENENERSGRVRARSGREVKGRGGMSERNGIDVFILKYTISKSTSSTKYAI